MLSCTLLCTYRSQRTALRSWFSPSTLWAPGIGLLLSDSCGSALSSVLSCPSSYSTFQMTLFTLSSFYVFFNCVCKMAHMFVQVHTWICVNRFGVSLRSFSTLVFETGFRSFAWNLLIQLSWPALNPRDPSVSPLPLSYPSTETGVYTTTSICCPQPPGF